MSISEPSTPGPLQLDDFCRICLLRKSQLRPLASKYSTAVMIPEMLYKITGALLNLQEQLPRVICKRCLVKLDLAYSIAEEFRAQEELLRRLWFKGTPLVDQLVAYQQQEESHRKPYSEKVIERLAGTERQEQATNLNGMAVREPTAVDAAEICIEIHSDDSDDEAVAGNRKPPDELGSDPKLEMVLELEDLQKSGVLPVEALEQLAMQGMDDPSPAESETEQVYDGKKTKTNSSLQCKYCPMTFYYQFRLMAHQTQHEKVYEDRRSASRSSSTSQQKESNLKRHEKSHEQQDILQCKLCPRIYSTVTYLAKHMLIEHGETFAETTEESTTDFRCTRCKRSYDAEWKLREHMRRHNNAEAGKFQCKKCNQLFPNRHQLERHERAFDTQCPLQIVRDGRTLYKCRHCSNVYVSRSNFAYHAKGHQTPLPEAFQCPDCGKRFGQRTNLRIHQQEAHNSFVKVEPAEETTTILHCIECDTLFQTQQSYEAHLSEHRTDALGSSEAAVESTNDVANQPLDLEEEETQQTRTSEPATVEITSDDESEDNASDRQDQLPATSGSSGDSDQAKSSSSYAIIKNQIESAIRKHMVRHENVIKEKYKCEVCDKLFNTISKLQYHRRLIHNLNVQQEVECEICQKQIKLNRYQYHLDCHRNIELRLIVCDQCNRAFGARHLLVQHKDHCKSNSPVIRDALLKSDVEREGRFKCNECGKRFKNWESIASHTSMHRALKEGLFKCQICQLACHSSSHLETHMMQEHPQPAEQLPLTTEQNGVVQQQTMEID